MLAPRFHLHWPNDQMFVVENRRILFQPIAKNACTSLKTLMVELSDHPDRAAILRNVHTGTDDGRTGLLLRDHDEDRARSFFAAPGFFRFTVLRAPLDRLLSAYVEKFVVNRAEPYQHYATGPVVATVQGRETAAEADHATGITFRQFAEHVIAQPLHGLDPHWRPQIDYLTSLGFDHLYTIADLDLLARDLGAHLGRTVDIGHKNRSRETRLVHEPGAADRLPREIEQRVKGLDSDSFYDADLRAKVAAFFAADHTLHAAAAAAQAARRQAIAAEARLGEAEPLAPRAEPGRLRTPAGRRLRKALSLNALRRALGRPVPQRRR